MQLLDEVKSAGVKILRAIHATINQDNVDPQETQNANTIIERTMHQEIMKMLQVMQRKIPGLKVQINNNSNSNDATLNTSVEGKRENDLALSSRNIVGPTVHDTTLAKTSNLKQKDTKMQRR